MYENAISWRRKLRIKSLVGIARQELDSGKKFEQITDRLEEEMQIQWKLVPGTRKQYLQSVQGVLENKYFV